MLRALALFPSARASTAKALGILEVEGAEAPLLQILDSGEPEIRDAVIGALASVGTAASVAALHAMGTPAAENAVRAIKERLVEAGSGQLSVSGVPATGQLTLAESGDLSLAKPPAHPIPRPITG